MSNRHLSRSIVLQSLFEWDVRGYSDADIEAVVDRNVDEFAPGTADRSFPIALAKRVLEHKTALDTVIEKAAPEWPLSQISLVDRNVLRIGLYELIYADKSEVPAKVAINEAIELAKSFGGESSGKFVNGVLGTVYKEMGEPGKDEVSKKKRRDDTPVDITKLPVEKKAGALVYAVDESHVHIALVHDVFGYWTMPKGTVEEGETEEEAAVREVHEEIGIPVEIVEKLGENEYTASHPQRGKYRKKVVYYIAKADKGELHLEDEKGGLDDVRWFMAEELEELAMYDDMVPIIARGISRIAELNK